MNSWQLIFLQSRANNGAYGGDGLPAQSWDWPRGTWFQKRLGYLRKTQRQRITKKGPFPMSFSLVPLLLAEEEIPAEARQALLENRRQDAAEVLMEEYGLSCIEASDLLDVSAC